MKLSTALVLLASTGTTNAFVVPSTSATTTSSSALCAEIRPPTPKNEVLEFGWDGTTALGGAVDDSQPARMLDEIRASGETQNSACDLFNANLGECNGCVCIYALCISVVEDERERRREGSASICCCSVLNDHLIDVLFVFHSSLVHRSSLTVMCCSLFCCASDSIYLHTTQQQYQTNNNEPNNRDERR